MAERREMAAERLRELREEAGELRRTLGATAAAARGLHRLASSFRLLTACVLYIILLAAVKIFVPGGDCGAPGSLAVGLASAALVWYIFLEVRAFRSDRRLFLERSSALAEKVRDLRSRLAALGTGSEADEVLRELVDSLPDLAGQWWLQFSYDAVHVSLMVVACLHFLLGLKEIYQAWST